jgi:hypothetical protein
MPLNQHGATLLTSPGILQKRLDKENEALLSEENRMNKQAAAKFAAIIAIATGYVVYPNRAGLLSGTKGKRRDALFFQHSAAFLTEKDVVRLRCTCKAILQIFALNMRSFPVAMAASKAARRVAAQAGVIENRAGVAGTPFNSIVEWVQCFKCKNRRKLPNFIHESDLPVSWNCNTPRSWGANYQARPCDTWEQEAGYSPTTTTPRAALFNLLTVPIAEVTVPIVTEVRGTPVSDNRGRARGGDEESDSDSDHNSLDGFFSTYSNGQQQDGNIEEEEEEE